MVRISDARMSGTAFGTVVLHVTPEAADGGPLAIVRTGDRIRLDVPARRLELLVDDDEIAARLAALDRPAERAGARLRPALRPARAPGRRRLRFRLPPGWRGDPEMPLLTEDARGVYVIAVTPFADDGAVDVAERRPHGRLLRGGRRRPASPFSARWARRRSSPPRSRARWSQQVLRRLDGRLPVVVGVSAPGLAPMRELADSVMAMGAAGVMVGPPWTLRTDDQIFGYYAAVADALGPTPFALQDYPLTTGVTIAPKVIERIVREVPTCVMLKHEDWPGLAKISALRAASDGGARRISILCGNGGLFLPEEMGRGADGAMTGFCFPEMMVGVVREHGAGNVERAHDIFDAYLPLARYEQQQGIGLAGRKYVLARRGVIATAKLRARARSCRPRTSAISSGCWRGRKGGWLRSDKGLAVDAMLSAPPGRVPRSTPGKEAENRVHHVCTTYAQRVCTILHVPGAALAAAADAGRRDLLKPHDDDTVVRRGQALTFSGADAGCWRKAGRARPRGGAA